MAVWQDCEFCGKFTFTFSTKFYLSVQLKTKDKHDDQQPYIF